MATLLDKLSTRHGRPWPLGASTDDDGVNFALFSAHAEAVELCLFDGKQSRSFNVTQCTDQVWHIHVAGARPGMTYAYRVHGPFLPEQGHRFDENRLLVDPYAREVLGRFHYAQSGVDDGSNCLTAAIIDENFDWGDDAPPDNAWRDSVLYEVHVKGATRQHPGVPEALRGTYAGLASPAMLKHFMRLGITAVNLLPVHCFLDEERLVHSGRVNYWGYNTLSFFAPEPRYAARRNGQSVIAEFRSMVRTLHAEGIEVILDVVYNHTAETDEEGPTISFRGIDNRSYYRLRPDNLALYDNFTGCGNTLNLSNPRVLQLVMDSLRYWVREMHVDGFRFDLAATLTRDSAFLAAVTQDPLLAGVKMIAEPWDLGPDGYRLGRFPPGWGEWNDRFRDDVRAFWLTGEVGPAGLAQRIAGSSELFHFAGRTPQAGISFITAHDGFTLRDLVSYQHKHNDLNGENNRDGHGHNLSTNSGEEGDSLNPEVLARRRDLQRSLLATLLFSQGVPMLQGGDELGRTQSGNNNAYCQDNLLTWFDWKHADETLTDFVGGIVALRQRFPQLRQARWLTGAPDKAGRQDIVWWHPAGHAMQVEDWHSPNLDAFGFLLAPEAGSDSSPVLCLINRAAATNAFALPPGNWEQLCDTTAAAPFDCMQHERVCPIKGRSIILLSMN